MLRESRQQFFEFEIYPATTATRLRVVQGDEHIGDLRFAPLMPADCPLSTSHPFRVISCGLLVTLEWDTLLPFDTKDIDGVDAQVWELDRRRRSLGFYFEGPVGGRDRLTLRFGFLRPVGSQVLIRLTSVDLVGQGNAGLAEVPLKPPLRHRVTLVSPDRVPG